MNNAKDHRKVSIPEETQRKFDELKVLLKKMGSALVAFSGGVDSTFLVKIAQDVLKDRIFAVIASSESYPKSETLGAIELAKEMGIPHMVIRTRELENPDFSHNPPKRCYHCKMELFSRLQKIAEEKGLSFVLDGSNFDDIGDYRPGLQACEELGIRSPLREVKLKKEEIRILSKKKALPTWNKPSLACLASRFPYNSAIDKASLEQVAKAEEYLWSLGFSQVRVRHHGPVARVEVDAEGVQRLFEPSLRAKIVTNLKQLGYSYVTMDLAGYRTGSMNEPLSDEIKSKKM
ncbi:MAG: ATP-dependent sacrificial sulfur transferase LarE [Candidatus Aminicenantes bacterium]